ncbi:zinc finger protein 646 [Amia ocellicauda]|uniref:zinc finger protein 646 n=1 Tax=Amia ocellicauda TaxID=2972642 RepID=UPI0034641B95
MQLNSDPLSLAPPPPPPLLRSLSMLGLQTQGTGTMPAAAEEEEEGEPAVPSNRCMACEETFPTLAALLVHQTSHAYSGLLGALLRVSCPQCGASFASQELLEDHQCAAAVFICSCGLGFLRFGLMREHMRLHGDSPPLEYTGRGGGEEEGSEEEEEEEEGRTGKGAKNTSNIEEERERSTLPLPSATISSDLRSERMLQHSLQSSSANAAATPSPCPLPASSSLAPAWHRKEERESGVKREEEVTSCSSSHSLPPAPPPHAGPTDPPPVTSRLVLLDFLCEPSSCPPAQSPRDIPSPAPYPQLPQPSGSQHRAARSQTLHPTQLLQQRGLPQGLWTQLRGPVVAPHHPKSALAVMEEELEEWEMEKTGLAPANTRPSLAKPVPNATTPTSPLLHLLPPIIPTLLRPLSPPLLLAPTPLPHSPAPILAAPLQPLPAAPVSLSRHFNPVVQLETRLRFPGGGEKRHKCGFCHRTFRTLDRAIEHHHAEHLGHRVQGCSLCGHLLLTQKSLPYIYPHRHVCPTLSGKALPRYSCGTVLQARKKKPKPKQQQQEQEEEEQGGTCVWYRCKDCTMFFGRQEDLDRHLATHAVRKKFECRWCQRSYTRLYTLRQHRCPGPPFLARVPSPEATWVQAGVGMHGAEQEVIGQEEEEEVRGGGWIEEEQEEEESEQEEEQEVRGRGWVDERGEGRGEVEEREAGWGSQALTEGVKRLLEEEERKRKVSCSTVGTSTETLGWSLKTEPDGEVPVSPATGKPGAGGLGALGSLDLGSPHFYRSLLGPGAPRSHRPRPPRARRSCGSAVSADERWVWSLPSGSPTSFRPFKPPPVPAAPASAPVPVLPPDPEPPQLPLLPLWGSLGPYPAAQRLAEIVALSSVQESKEGRQVVEEEVCVNVVEVDKEEVGEGQWDGALASQLSLCTDLNTLATSLSLVPGLLPPTPTPTPSLLGRRRAGEKRFVCGACGAGYTRRHRLYLHHQKCRVGGAQGRPHENHKQSQGAKQRFVCAQCGVGYTRRHRLSIHQQKCRAPPLKAGLGAANQKGKSQGYNEGATARNVKESQPLPPAQKGRPLGPRPVLPQPSSWSLSLQQSSQRKNFVCSRCGADYTRRTRLWAHQKKCRLGMGGGGERVATDGGGNGQLQGTMSSMMSSNSDSKNNSDNRSSAGRKRFVCGLCGTSYSRRYSLYLHQIKCRPWERRRRRAERKGDRAESGAEGRVGDRAKGLAGSGSKVGVGVKAKPGAGAGWGTKIGAGKWRQQVPAYKKLTIKQQEEEEVEDEEVVVVLEEEEEEEEEHKPSTLPTFSPPTPTSSLAPPTRVTCECGKVFTCPQRLLQHLKTHVQELFPCLYCSLSFHSSSLYHAHLASHQDARCLDCGRHFAKLPALRRHRRQGPCAAAVPTSNNNSSSSSSHRGKKDAKRAVPRSHRCPSCSVEFSTSYNLNRHRQRGACQAPPRPIRCPVCRQGFEGVANLQRHLACHSRPGALI